MPRISPSGSISESVGPFNISGNPLTESAGISTGANLINSGDVNLNVGVGAGIGPKGPGLGVTPTLQFGQGQNAQGGATLGSSAGSIGGGILGLPFGPAGVIAGGAAGALALSAVGSLVGGAFDKSPKRKEHNRRNSFINKLRELGVVGTDYSFMFPDGSQGNFQGDAGQMHQAKDPSKLVGGQRGELFGFESDYTNDLDYVAAMTGITLSRMLGGGKDKAIDQVGNLMGNQFLGKVGFGQDFTPENFNAVIDNARAMYAKSGIKSKEEFMALSNEAFSQSRFNDADRAVAQQVANLVFDKDFGQASQLMNGRQKGLETAARTPSQGSGARAPRKGTIFDKLPTGIPGAKWAPILSFEEAQLAVAPAVRYLESVKGKSTGPSSLQSFVNNLRGGADLVKGLGGLYQSIDKLTEGGLSDLIGLGGGGEFETPDVSLPDTLDFGDLTGGGDGGFISAGEDFGNEVTAVLDSTLDFSSF
jgi:hypothetical protein